MSTMPDSSVKPAVIIGADSRFATTFLSNKYRDKAVGGEVLMDKTTGEIYIKRVSDGKIVSFYQNKKMSNDLALELRVLLLNNKAFVYPSESETAFYISTNYDLNSIHNEVLYDLTKDDVIISGEPDDMNKLMFKLSGGTNGFFCRICTRDVDKPYVEYLTNQYNQIIKNYTGDNDDYLVEYEKFDLNEQWEKCDATVTYDVVVTKDGTETTYTDLVGYIRLNDNSLVLLPDEVNKSFDSAIIDIKSITFDKIHFMINHKSEFDTSVINNIDRLISIDNRIEVCECVISHFINDASDIILLGKEVIVAFLTVPHLNEYMLYMRKLIEREVPIEISETQPTFHCIWFQPY